MNRPASHRTLISPSVTMPTVATRGALRSIRLLALLLP
jgi:hypothetical protein